MPFKSKVWNLRQYILCLYRSLRADKVKDADWNNPLSSDNPKVVSSQPGNKSGNAVPDAPHGSYIQRINNDAREDEMEENMQAVGGILGNLKNMAQDMGAEMDRQNKQLDTIGGKVIISYFFDCKLSHLWSNEIFRFDLYHRKIKL